jgi:hypothetical protein
MSSGATAVHAASPCAYCGDDAAPLACERCGAAAFCDASCRKLGARAHGASCDAVVATRGQAAACGRSAAAARAAAASEARVRAAVRVERRDLERRARAAARRARDARDDVDCHAVRVSGAGPVAVAGPAFAVSDGTLREVSRLLEPLARCEVVDGMVVLRAGKECEISNFKGSYLGRFSLVSADFWTNDHLSERYRSVDAFSGTRARGTLTLKRR